MNFSEKTHLLKDLIITTILDCLVGLSFFGSAQTLVHSYNFEGNAQDLVGEAHGVLHGGVIENGRYITSLNGNHIALPAEKIKLSQYHEISLEFYLESPSGNGWNTMLGYFGRTTNEGYGADYLYFSPKNGGQTKTAISCLESNTPWSVETSLAGNVLEDNEPHHAVVTISETQLKLYIDGALVSSSALSANNKLSNISNELAYLGKGGYRQDPSWFGSIDAFHIYDGILTSSVVSQHAITYFAKPEVIATSHGKLDQGARRIQQIEQVSVREFLEGLRIYKNAKAYILDADGESITDRDQPLSSSMKLMVSGSEEALYSLEVRSIGTGNKVKWAFNAQIDQDGLLIYELYQGLTAKQFLSGIQISPYATSKLFDRNGAELAVSDLVSSNSRLEVTAENEEVRAYTVFLGDQTMGVKAIADTVQSFHQLPLGNYELEADVVWYVLDDKNPLPGSKLNLMGEGAWVYFPGIKPQTFSDQFLGQLTIDGAKSIPDQNMRLVQYGAGCVIIPHPNSFKPLTVYADGGFSGESKQLELYTYYKIADAWIPETAPRESLGSFDDNIESFRLKKGYMATFSTNANGTGVSQVFIADKEDVMMEIMPEGLNNTVSFVRVFPWRWVNKKGYVGNAGDGETAGAQWVYCHCDSHGEESSLNVEYVPLRHNPGWPSYSSIQTKQNVTHALFFNEPDNPVDDGYSTVAEAINQYPNLLASGLRVVSPAVTDGGAGWLFDFVDQCKEKNYRLDAVAVHFYRGCQSSRQFFDFLNYVHTETGLPVWITEFNNGCNWSDQHCKPTTYEQQADVIKEWVDMLEAAPFVERYAIWPGCETYQQFWGPDGITPAGANYRDKVSGFGYSSVVEHDYHFYPADDQEHIIPGVTLSWLPAPGSHGQLLYLGTSEEPEYSTQLAGHVGQFEVADLDFNQTYYWRIDQYEVDGTTIKGETLQFSTYTHQKASNPFPSDGGFLGLDAIHFSWKSDNAVLETHRVYLGEDQYQMELIAELADEISDYQLAHHDLQLGKTYQWRVDEVIDLGDGKEVIQRGDTWSFDVVNVLDASPISHKIIYPNPTNEELFISNVERPVAYSITNLAGQQVRAGVTEGGIKLDDLNPGIYFLHLEGLQKIKFIVE